MAACNTGSTSFIDASGIPKACASNSDLSHIISVALTIVGAVALLLLVITGLRFVLSSGDPNKTAELRRQIAYIAVGLILIVLSDAIVTFIINKAS